MQIRPVVATIRQWQRRRTAPRVTSPHLCSPDTPPLPLATTPRCLLVHDARRRRAPQQPDQLTTSGPHSARQRCGLAAAAKNTDAHTPHTTSASHDGMTNNQHVPCSTGCCHQCATSVPGAAEHTAIAAVCPAAGAGCALRRSSRDPTPKGAAQLSAERTPPPREHVHACCVVWHAGVSRPRPCLPPAGGALAGRMRPPCASRPASLPPPPRGPCSHHGSALCSPHTFPLPPPSPSPTRRGCMGQPWARSAAARG